MSQESIVRDMYVACIEHDRERQIELRKQELAAISQAKKNGENLSTPAWTIFRG